MTKKKTAKALLASVLALVLCLSMLIGTTFAWFTDSVTSAGNKIQAGTLQIDLELLEENADGTTTWKSIKESQEPLFNYDKWEPGYTDVTILKVVNKGTLALKWCAKFISQTELSSLANVIDVYVCPSETTELTYPTDRDLEGYTKVGTLSEFINSISNTTYGDLLPEASAYLGIALKMQETAGNEYQGMELGGAFDIQIFATQYTYEADSFDNQYDKSAAWTGSANTDWYNTTDTSFVLSSAEELAGFAELVNSGSDTFTGKTVKLGANIDLNDIAWTPIGNNLNGWKNKFGGTFSGTGYTISNLYVTGTKGVGLFGYVGPSAHIEGVTIDGAYVSGNDYVGAVMGTGYLAANCLKNNTVKNATIIAMPYLMEDGVTYDGGAKAGAVAGFATNGSIIGNKAVNCSISAYRDLGGIVGMAQGEDRNITVSENAADTITLTYLVASPYAEGKVNENMGGIVGRKNASVTVENNTEAIVKFCSEVSTADTLIEALESGENVVLTDDVKIEPANMSNAYGTTGINIKNGQTIDGNGNTLDINGAGGTWDSGISTTGGLIKNLTVTGSFRGIFINHNSDHSEPVVLENVTIDGTTYTISCDQGMNQGLIATNSTFNGWTSYAATLGTAEFTNCSFGEGNGYAYMRPYAPTSYINCKFEAGYEMDARAAVTFENCTLDGVAITAENLATLVTSNFANATVK